MLLKLTLPWLFLASLASTQQRVAPGVPTNQYQQQQQQQPQRGQVAQQGGHYQAGAPGVPPQQYQQAPGVPPQQYQQQQQYQQPQQYQQQQQFQQPQQQQFQPPPPPQQPQQQQQQFQQPQQVQQQPQMQPHGGHGGGGHNQRVLHNPNLSSERDHIKDHLEVPIDTASMSDQELQFHYFKMHDADNNNKLDGQELIKSLFHWHDSANHEGKAGHPQPEEKLFTDIELVNMIDPILDQDDKNKDGFIDYPEFVQAQRNAAAAAASNTHA
ncbi:adenylate cyclase, terminal-differentiation specific-like [Portunus trituberculatus]|uniref:adenylate cyclase, terminal-differentiation specific-like n=1 Tax=Portunus trituberculatus TaxID=210409 RepID=UPI001E1CCAB4|nr:adenylate cyclase, terminal-differentiation specific-like [Portunus trituberculatus]